MVALAPPRTSPWLDWLSYWAEVRGYGDNKSKLATYLEIEPGTVRAWWNRGTRPSYSNVIQTADKLKRPRTEALAAAEYETESSVDVPGEPKWVVTLIDSIVHADLSPSEARLVESQVRGLLQFREERAAYEANPPAAPGSPLTE